MDIECLYQIILYQMYLFQIYPKFVSSLETSLNGVSFVSWSHFNRYKHVCMAHIFINLLLAVLLP